MWLLNARKLKLEHFNSEHEVPGGYAILSHRWGREEVTFSEIESPEAKWKIGYRKIEFACTQALKTGLLYVWLDTCCIDKKSSAELSEAINSMFRYYANATRCYVYLADILSGPSSESDLIFRQKKSDPFSSEWFTRGWTLQELIAPRIVLFFDCDGNYMGSKHNMAAQIANVTRISTKVLSHRTPLAAVSVAARMSWAALRLTSRVEDEAYCLLGIFDVNMPLLYGEGKKAFRRLQEEIIRQSSVVDHSILAWEPDADILAAWPGQLHYPNEVMRETLFSPSASGFRNSADVISWALPDPEIFELVQSGLRMSVATRKTMYPSPHHSERTFEILLNCSRLSSPNSPLILRAQERPRVERLIMPKAANKTGIAEAVHDRYDLIRQKVGLLASASPESIVSWEDVTLILGKGLYRWQDYRLKVHVCLDSPALSITQAAPRAVPKAVVDRASANLSDYCVLDLSKQIDDPVAVGEVGLEYTDLNGRVWYLQLAFELKHVKSVSDEPTITVSGYRMIPGQTYSVRHANDLKVLDEEHLVFNVRTRLISVPREIIWGLTISAKVTSELEVAAKRSLSQSVESISQTSTQSNSRPSSPESEDD